MGWGKQIFSLPLQKHNSFYGKERKRTDTYDAAVFHAEGETP